MKPRPFDWWRILLWVAVVAATCTFLYAVRSILLPFILAFVIAVLLEPTIQKLRRRGMSRGLAISVVFLLFFGVLTGLILRVAPMINVQLSGFSTRLQSITTNFATTQTDGVFERWNPVVRAQAGLNPNPVDQFLESFRGPLERVGIPADRRVLVQQYVEPHRARIARSVQNFFNGFLGLVISASSQFFMLLFTPIFAFLMLLDMDSMRIRSVGWIPSSIRAETIALLREVGQVFVSYLRGVTITVAVYALLMMLVLSVLGVPYAILMALLAAAIYMVPYIGGLIGSLSIFFVVALNGQTGNFMFSMASPWAYAGVVTLVFYGLSALYDQFIMPRFMGGAVGLNMLVSMFVVLAGGALFGLVGMMLAFPVAGSVKVILQKILRVSNTTSVESLRLPATPLRHRTAGEV